MRKKSGHILLLSLLFLVTESSAYKDMPALVHLNKTEQADTIGFNLVESMCALFYPHILSGELPLYIGPDKKLRIDAAALTALETSNGTSFSKCPDFFIHEYWSSSRKKSSFTIIGFSFINKNLLNEKVVYGYIDFADADSLLRHTLIPNSANGSANLTYMDALLSRKYVYHLVQLGQEAFYSDPSLSVRLKREAFHSGKEIVNLKPVEPRKEIAYQVLRKKYSTDIDWSNELLDAMERVLRENPELYFNLGGQRYSAFPDTAFSFPQIKGILVEETWVKENRKPQLQSARIKIILGNGDLFWLELAELERYGILLHYMTVKDILKEKPFEYDLYRINNQDIDPEQGEKYMTALMKAPWNQLNAYVRQ